MIDLFLYGRETRGILNQIGSIIQNSLDRNCLRRNIMNVLNAVKYYVDELLLTFTLSPFGGSYWSELSSSSGIPSGTAISPLGSSPSSLAKSNSEPSSFKNLTLTE